MTITPEKIKELRELMANHGKSTWAYYLNFSDAMPALLDAAEENVRLRKFIQDSVVGCSSCQGTGWAYMHGGDFPCGACLGFRKILEEK